MLSLSACDLSVHLADSQSAHLMNKSSSRVRPAGHSFARKVSISQPVSVFCLSSSCLQHSCSRHLLAHIITRPLKSLRSGYRAAFRVDSCTKTKRRRSHHSTSLSGFDLQAGQYSCSHVRCRSVQYSFCHEYGLVNTDWPVRTFCAYIPPCSA